MLRSLSNCTVQHGKPLARFRPNTYILHPNDTERSCILLNGLTCISRSFIILGHFLYLSSSLPLLHFRYFNNQPLTKRVCSPNLLPLEKKSTSTVRDACLLKSMCLAPSVPQMIRFQGRYGGRKGDIVYFNVSSMTCKCTKCKSFPEATCVTWPFVINV